MIFLHVFDELKDIKYISLDSDLFSAFSGIIFIFFFFCQGTIPFFIFMKKPCRLSNDMDLKTFHHSLAIHIFLCIFYLAN
jgi:hypothetical protein